MTVTTALLGGGAPLVTVAVAVVIEKEMCSLAVFRNGAHRGPSILGVSVAVLAG